MPHKYICSSCSSELWECDSPGCEETEDHSEDWADNRCPTCLRRMKEKHPKRYYGTPIVVLGEGKIVHCYGRGEIEGNGDGWAACGKKSPMMMLATATDWEILHHCEKCQPLRTQWCSYCGSHLLFSEEEWSQIVRTRPTRVTVCCPSCYEKGNEATQEMVGYEPLK